jgi:hypothetical protein
LKGTDALEWELEPGHCAMISVRKAVDHPQVVSTDRHLLQGWVDLEDVQWNAETKELSGVAKVIGGEAFKIVLATNGVAITSVKVDQGKAVVETHPDSKDLRVLVIESPETTDVKWGIQTTN